MSGRAVNPLRLGRQALPVLLALLVALAGLGPALAADQKQGKNGKDEVVVAEATVVAQDATTVPQDATGDPQRSGGGGGGGEEGMVDKDSDGDYIPDFLDNCATAQNPNQEDSNGDGIGDACAPRPDGDGDGVPDLGDNCAGYPNSDQADSDSDGYGDLCDGTPYGPGSEPIPPPGYVPEGSESSGGGGDGGKDLVDPTPREEARGDLNEQVYEVQEEPSSTITQNSEEQPATINGVEQSGDVQVETGPVEGGGQSSDQGAETDNGNGRNRDRNNDQTSEPVDLTGVGGDQASLETAPPDDGGGGGGRQSDGGGGGGASDGGGRDRPRKNLSMPDTLPAEPPPVPTKSMSPSAADTVPDFAVIARIDAGDVPDEPAPEEAPPPTDKGAKDRPKRARATETTTTGVRPGASPSDAESGDGGTEATGQDGSAGDGADPETGDNVPVPVTEEILPNRSEPKPEATAEPEATATPEATAVPGATRDFLTDPALFAKRAKDRTETGDGGPAPDAWQRDTSYIGGTYQKVHGDLEIAGTDNDALYMTQRVGVDRGKPGAFVYEIPVPADGRYLVRLYFCELIWGTSPDRPGEGQRVFSVSAEGETRLADYDIFGDVGALTASVKQFTVDVNDGKLTLRFWGSKDQPVVSAIEVYDAPRGDAETQDRGSRPADAADETGDASADLPRRAPIARVAIG